jgi:DNA-binding HxlR family transcriptional regulator
MAAEPLPADPEPLPLDGLQAAVGVLAAKWSVAVIAQLAGGTLRFSELLRRVDGVSRRMLSVTLRQLERDGLVVREVHAIAPARVDYELSAAGRQLLAALAPLAGWGAEHGQQLLAARETFDRLQAWRVESSELQARTQATPRIV